MALWPKFGNPSGIPQNYPRCGSILKNFKYLLAIAHAAIIAAGAATTVAQATTKRLAQTTDCTGIAANGGRNVEAVFLAVGLVEMAAALQTAEKLSLIHI